VRVLGELWKEFVEIEVHRLKGKLGIWYDVFMQPIKVPSKAVHMSEDPKAYWCHQSGLMVQTPEEGGHMCYSGNELFLTEECFRCVFLNYGV